MRTITHEKKETQEAIKLLQNLNDATRNWEQLEIIRAFRNHILEGVAVKISDGSLTTDWQKAQTLSDTAHEVRMMKQR